MHIEQNKYTHYKKVKVTSSSEIFKIIYVNGSCLLLFGKEKITKFWNFIWIVPLTLK